MAPPPEFDKEPKAPDKSVTNISSDDTTNTHNLDNELQTNSDNKTRKVKGIDVDALNDIELKDLLDEAISYKRPKDRDGKSNLFRGLLDEVEQDDEVGKAVARSFSSVRSSNSLTNLFVAACLVPDAPHSRPHPTPAPAPVSARAIHGGSLPSGVDTSSLVCEEPAEYVATVRCFNPSPLTDTALITDAANVANSVAIANNTACSTNSVTAHETDPLNRRNKPMYTARATLEIGSGSVCTGRAVTTTTASNQIDTAISFSCITTPEVVTSCSTTSSTAQATVAVDSKPLQLGSCYRAVGSLTGSSCVESIASTDAAETPTADDVANDTTQQARSVITSSFNGLPLSRPNYGATASTTTTSSDEYKKSLDENGNSVQGYNSASITGSSQHSKKPRRKKSSKNESVIESQNIDGYQGNKDLNEVLRFIESNADSSRAHKLGRAKHKDDSDEKGGKKRSTERRKDKENKIKRATSLEELSRTKLEDLTDKPEPTLRKNKKERWTDGDPSVKAERRSWGDDARELYADTSEAASVELTDFQTVTKKRKPRRRTDEAEKEALGDAVTRRARPPSPRPRRESAPPSDRSNDSNDDMDSVHSLPAPAPASAAHHASYADIARTRHNIPDLIESCNFYAENANSTTTVSTAAGDVDGYPALDRGVVTRVARTPPTKPPERKEVRRERKERGDCPAPDVVADRRPPVVLLDSTARPRELDGVTFGFDINEQLLSGSSRSKPRCDLVREAAACDANEPQSGVVPVVAGSAALRYVPPAPASDTHLLHQLVDYVGSAWEDIMRCSGGKVLYYTD